MRRLVVAALLALGVVTGCSPDPDRPLRLDIRHVALDPADPGVATVGELVWRGGLALTRDGAAAFPYLRGMDVVDGGPRTAAFSIIARDQSWFEGEMRLDAKGALAGLGAVYRDAPDAGGCGRGDLGEPEDMGWLDDEQVLVSFDRGVALGDPSCLTPANPTLNRRPDVVFHAVASAGPGAFYVAGAADGALWRCGYGSEEQTGCKTIRAPGGPEGAPTGFELVSMDHLADRRTLLMLWRSLNDTGAYEAIVSTYDPPADGAPEPPSRVVARFGKALQLGSPEAISAHLRGGVYRIYVASNDDRARPARNLIQAFDWTAPAPAHGVAP